MAKRESRNDKFTRLASEAEAALNELADLQSEYQSWYDNFPENAQGSATYEKLQGIVDLDLEGALDTCAEAAGLDMPLGFGRD